MMRCRKLGLCAVAAVMLVAAAASDAGAQIMRVDDEPRQAVGFHLGYFAVRGEDARTDGDVLFANLAAREPLLFDVKDFNGVVFGGEYLFGLSEYLEAGVGASLYQRTVPSIYADVVNDNGSEIEQDLKLRIVPLTATVRFLPLGRGGVEPYVGAGIGFFNWRYSETGEFVDTHDFSIFRESYVADGTSTGPIILGGVRLPMADTWSIGGELRYQRAEGDIDTDDVDLLGDKIDLGGTSVMFTVHLRF